MAAKISPQDTPDLLGGWMPAGWWGDDAEPKPKRQSRKARSSKGLKKRDPRLQTFRRRYEEVPAIVSADVEAKRRRYLPFKVELSNQLDGEGYFLTLCQTLYRERACREVLGEPLAGEDLIAMLIYWWVQGPLTPGNLRAATRDTSLDLGDSEDEDD